MRLRNNTYRFLGMVILIGASWAVNARTSEEDPVYQIAGHGYLAAVDCRQVASHADYAEGVRKIRDSFGAPVSNCVGQTFSLGNARDLLQRSGGAMAVFIVDDPALPMTLTATEDRWAVVNVASLNDDHPDQKKFCRRVALLFTRQACRVLGGDEAKGYSSCFHVVLSARDLDEITSFDVTMGPELSIREAMPLRGIVPPLYGTYEDACEMGVAAPPTNEYQKAIWDKVYTPPSNPIKIKYDPKKGK